MKTPEGRQRNQENQKRHKEERKATKAAKRAQHQAETSTPLQRLAGGSKEDAGKKRSAVIKEVGESMPLDSANVRSTTNNPSTSSTDAPKMGTELEKTHDVTSMSIISSSHIQQKVTRALGILSEYPTIPPAKPKVVMLYSKAAVASKMISVAEIVKREIVKNGGKWFQYNKLGQVMEEKRHKEGDAKKEKGAGADRSLAENEDEDAGHESEGGFETMKTPFERAIEGKPKIRAIPVMALCLSRVRIDSLRKDHT
jgi:hypothetical protein